MSRSGAVAAAVIAAAFSCAWLWLVCGGEKRLVGFGLGLTVSTCLFRANVTFVEGFAGPQSSLISVSDVSIFAVYHMYVGTSS